MEGYWKFGGGRGFKKGKIVKGKYDPKLEFQTRKASVGGIFRITHLHHSSVPWKFASTNICRGGLELKHCESIMHLHLTQRNNTKGWPVKFKLPLLHRLELCDTKYLSASVMHTYFSNVLRHFVGLPTSQFANQD